jgi:hypothetical protein
MTNSQRLAAVRRCLDRWLEKQQSDGDIEISDAVLIRGGFYVGRKFQLGPYRAVWFMEEDEVKIHDAGGSVVASLDSAAIEMASRIASPLEARIPAATPAAEVKNQGIITIPMQRPISANATPQSQERIAGTAGAEPGASEHSIRRAA